MHRSCSHICKERQKRSVLKTLTDFVSGSGILEQLGSLHKKLLEFLEQYNSQKFSEMESNTWNTYQGTRTQRPLLGWC